MPDTQHRSCSDNVALHTRRVSAFVPESPVLVCFLLYHLLVSFLPNISLPFHKYSLLLITTKCQYIFSSIFKYYSSTLRQLRWWHTKTMISKSIYIRLQVLRLILQSQRPKSSESEAVLLSILPMDLQAM